AQNPAPALATRAEAGSAPRSRAVVAVGGREIAAACQTTGWTLRLQTVERGGRRDLERKIVTIDNFLSVRRSGAYQFRARDDAARIPPEPRGKPLRTVSALPQRQRAGSSDARPSARTRGGARDSTRSHGSCPSAAAPSSKRGSSWPVASVVPVARALAFPAFTVATSSRPGPAGTLRCSSRTSARISTLQAAAARVGPPSTCTYR